MAESNRVQGFLLTTNGKGTTVLGKFKKRYFVSDGRFLRSFDQPDGPELWRLNLANVLKLMTKADNKLTFVLRLPQGFTLFLQGEHPEVTDMWIRHIRRVVGIAQDLSIQKQTIGYTLCTPLLNTFRQDYCTDVTPAQMVDFITVGVNQLREIFAGRKRMPRLEQSRFEKAQYLDAVPEKDKGKNVMSPDRSKKTSDKDKRGKVSVGKNTLKISSPGTGVQPVKGPPPRPNSAAPLPVRRTTEAKPTPWVASAAAGRGKSPHKSPQASLSSSEKSDHSTNEEEEGLMKAQISAGNLATQSTEIETPIADDLLSEMAEEFALFDKLITQDLGGQGSRGGSEDSGGGGNTEDRFDLDDAAQAGGLDFLDLMKQLDQIDESMDQELSSRTEGTCVPKPAPLQVPENILVPNRRMIQRKQTKTSGEFNEYTTPKTSGEFPLPTFSPKTSGEFTLPTTLASNGQRPAGSLAGFSTIPIKRSRPDRANPFDSETEGSPRVGGDFPVPRLPGTPETKPMFVSSRTNQLKAAASQDDIPGTGSDKNGKDWGSMTMPSRATDPGPYSKTPETENVNPAVRPVFLRNSSGDVQAAERARLLRNGSDPPPSSRGLSMSSPHPIPNTNGQQRSVASLGGRAQTQPTSRPASATIGGGVAPFNGTQSIPRPFKIMDEYSQQPTIETPIPPTTNPRLPAELKRDETTKEPEQRPRIGSRTPMLLRNPSGPTTKKADFPTRAASTDYIRSGGQTPPVSPPVSMEKLPEIPAHPTTEFTLPTSILEKQPTPVSGREKLPTPPSSLEKFPTGPDNNAMPASPRSFPALPTNPLAQPSPSNPTPTRDALTGSKPGICKLAPPAVEAAKIEDGKKVFGLNLFDAAAKYEPNIAKGNGEAFCQACWDNDMEGVKRYLRHPDLKTFANLPNSRGQPALYCAARQGHVEILVELLNCSEIDVHYQVESHGGTALHAAAFAQCAEGVALLLASGASQKIKNKAGFTGYGEARGGATSDVFLIMGSGVSAEMGLEALKLKYTRIHQLKAISVNVPAVPTNCFVFVFANQEKKTIALSNETLLDAVQPQIAKRGLTLQDVAILNKTSDFIPLDTLLKSIPGRCCWVVDKSKPMLPLAPTPPPNHVVQDSTHAQIVGFMWLIYAKVAIYNELHTSGLVRLDDPDGRIFNWIDSCEGVYERRSTHFPECVEETFLLNPGGQRGLDMRSDDANLMLPANKKTILFFRLQDGTTAVKMEKSGCPPFWREGFQTMDNAKEFASHSMDFCRTRVVANTGMAVSRKEDIPQRFIDAFEAALDIQFPNEDVDETLVPGKEPGRKQRLFKQGVKYGITEMIRIIEDLTHSPARSSMMDIDLTMKMRNYNERDRERQLAIRNKQGYADDDHGLDDGIQMIQQGQVGFMMRECIKILYDIVALDRQRGYKGQRRGEETCLASPFEWDELVGFAPLWKVGAQDDDGS